MNRLNSYCSNTKFFKGMPRPYVEAKSLGVIDKHIASLVDTMNYKSLIKTIASCQGHGCFYITTSPYISFKSSANVASMVAKSIQVDYSSAERTLNYYWELTAEFDSNFTLTYVLRIPNIVKAYAIRRRLNQDFELISLMLQEILNHFKIKKPKMKSKPN